MRRGRGRGTAPRRWLLLLLLLLPRPTPVSLAAEAAAAPPSEHIPALRLPSSFSSPPSPASAAAGSCTGARAAAAKRWNSEAFRPVMRRSQASILSDTGRSS
jgi:hypothetical protein